MPSRTAGSVIQTVHRYCRYPAGAVSRLNLYYEAAKYCRTVIPSRMSAVSLFPKTAACLEGLLSRCMTSSDSGACKKDVLPGLEMQVYPGCFDEFAHVA
jgi:hypothetical protein